MKTSLLAAFLCLCGLPAIAAHTQARLVLDSSPARPGDTVMAGIHFHMDPGWHTYWRSPGQEGGLPPTVTWQLPSGITAGKIQWPVPEKLKSVDPDVGTQPRAETVNYIYSKDVVLLVPLQLAKDLPSGTIDLKAKVTWLECAERLCVPGKADVQGKLEIGTEAQPSLEKPLIETWQKRLPKSADGLQARASWEGPAAGTNRPLIIEWAPATAANDGDFYPDKSEDFEIQPEMKKVSGAAGKIRLRTQIKKLEGEWPRQISGLLIEQSATATNAYDATLPIEEKAPAIAASATASASAESSLWLMLLYAFLGGVILNVMPCVLPVIALKILGFVNDAKSEPRRVRGLGLMYALGVIVSFEIFAGIIIGLKAAGKQAGWGLQFGNPQFLVILTVLVTLVALNLFGIFEVTAGRITGAAGTLASKHGASGAFLNGVLATVLATPCTAPFLSIALGFAFAQPPSLIILVFFTIGAGLAFPYLLLSWNPQWLKFLPKPGPWMENFKIIMGFPMLATAIWLFSLLTVHYGDRSWWLGIFLVIAGLAAWVFGRFVQRGQSGKSVAAAVAIALLLLGYFGVIEGRLHWRVRQTLSAGNKGIANQPKGIAWQAWSPEAVIAARAEGRPILVDFTARWCVTCNTIVKPALEDTGVRSKLEQIHAVALLADYTELPDSITEELKRFRRAGVPLVLVYPRSPSEPVIVLPDPSPLRGASHYRSVILHYLDKAAGTNDTIAQRSTAQ